MEYRDFYPKQIMSLNTGVVSVTMNMINSHSQAWLTQAAYTLLDNCCPGLNSYYHAIIKTGSEEIRSALEKRESELREFCKTVIQYISKPYDVQYSYPVEKERVVVEEVPKERKTGFFRKETYMEKVSYIQKYSEDETVTYKGWLLDRFYRTEGNGKSADTIFLDYCLGADGNIYMIAYLKDAPSNQQVFQCSYFSQGMLDEQYCNVYNAVLGGALGALDAVPIDTNDPLRNLHLQLDDDYYYNFPVELEDDQYSYGFLGGTYYRCILLLTEGERQRCFAENEWIYNKFV